MIANMDDIKASMVGAAYVRLVGVIFNKWTSAPVNSDESARSQRENAIEFAKLSEDSGAPVMFLMNAAILRYGRAWCLKTFGRPFPPFPVVVSPKMREWLIRQVPETIKQQRPDELAILYFRQLNPYGRLMATKLLDAGICPTQEITNEVRRLLIEEYTV